MESKAKDESASSEPNIDSCHPPTEDKNYNIVGSQNAGLQRVPDKRHEEPLSSVSSLEVHFDLLDLTELTDTSDQEHSEVFAELEEEDLHDLSSNRHQMQQAVYMPSPSWTRCSKTQHTRELKHCSDSENAETSED